MSVCGQIFINSGTIYSKLYFFYLVLRKDKAKSDVLVTNPFTIFTNTK